jgi:hypothetical protein
MGSLVMGTLPVLFFDFNLMKCQDAQKVWRTGNSIEGLMQHFPEALRFILKKAECFATNCPGGEFDTQVKALAGEGQYRLVYLDGQDQLAEQIHQILGDCALNQVLSTYLSNLYRRPIQMGNICCNACISAEPAFFLNPQLIEVQKAAIQIEGMKTGD